MCVHSRWRSHIPPGCVASGTPMHGETPAQTGLRKTRRDGVLYRFSTCSSYSLSNNQRSRATALLLLSSLLSSFYREESGRGVVWSEVIRTLLTLLLRQQNLGETDERESTEEDFGEAMHERLEFCCGASQSCAGLQ